MVRARLWGLVLLTTLTASAGTLSVRVDEPDLVVGKRFRLIVEVQGSDFRSLEAPDLDGARILQNKPVSTYTSTVILNNSKTSMTTLAYLLMPERAGEIEIPSFTAEIDGETVLSEPFTISVRESGSPTLDSERTLRVEDVLFSTIATDKDTAFVGEPIELSMEIWVRHLVAAVDGMAMNFPSLTGFYAVPRAPSEITRRRNEVQNGANYDVSTYVQTLYPATPGDLTIGPWTWEGALSVHPYGVSMQTLQTEPFVVHVKPLPDPPPGFSGSIGKYEITAALSRNETLQGVPVTLNVSVAGNGNPDAVGTPKLPEIPWAYLGEPNRQSLDANQNGFIFTYSLTPLEAGSQQISPIDYCYFDPELARYTTVSTMPIALNVRAATHGDSQIIVGAGGPESPESLGLDESIRPSVATAGSLQRARDLTVPTVFGTFAPVAGYVVLALVVRRKRRFATDIRYARAYHARAKATESLHAIANARGTTDQLYRSIATFLSDAYNLSDIGMTSEDAHSLFAVQRTPDDLANAFLKILKTCERARYAAVELTQDEIDALVQGALVAVERLDTHLKNGART